MGFLTHIGTFLLLVASILLLITTITAPVVNDFGMLKVTLTNGTNLRNSAIRFGTFGYCVTDAADGDYCTSTIIGYNPAQITANAVDVDYSNAAENTSKALTRVMVLHPVACGLAFIAFLLSLGSGFIGAIFAAIVSGVAFVVTVVVMACDFTLFGIIRNKIRDDGPNGSNANFDTGIWTILAAMIILFFATFLVLFSCCASRREKRRARTTTHHAKNDYGHSTTTRRRFWQRRTRY